MKRLALATCLLASAAAANALMLLRPQASLEVRTGEVEIQMGSQRLMVPRALIRDHAQMQGGRLERLDLVMQADTLEALPPVDARRPERKPPEHVSVVLTPSDDRLGSIDMFGKVYARFLSGETTASPAGLMLRRFREKTPYEDRELYLGVGTGKTFVALCPLPEAHDKEPCTTTFRFSGMDMELRFAPARLSQWRKITEHAFALVDEMTASPEVKANRIPLPAEAAEN